ncbi:MAG: aldehyde dehydrogenase family protein, partial [Verrucomicrobiales bacterium]
ARSVEMARAILRRFDFSTEEPSGEGAIVRRMPHGVVAVITPWNNPVYLPLGKILPAILAGNGVVWKPAPETNGIAQTIIEILHASGCPHELVQMIPGDARTGRSIMAHHCVDAVTMTASDAAGFSASEICGSRRIPLQAELGGNNAAIVLADADLTSAASKIASGAFEMSGQRCTANRRAIVESKCLAGFLNLLKVAMAGLCSGNPLDPETVIGPLVSRERRIKVAGMIRRAIADGHTVVQSTFDEERNGPSYFPPTLVLCDDPSHEIVREETFGPVLVIQSVENLEEALERCNAVRQGLAAAIFSTNKESIGHFLREARAGILKVNRSTADASVDVPFGGWKASGIGPAEHGEADLEFYFRTQTVYK